MAEMDVFTKEELYMERMITPYRDVPDFLKMGMALIPAGKSAGPNDYCITNLSALLHIGATLPSLAGTTRYIKAADLGVKLGIVRNLTDENIAEVSKVVGFSRFDPAMSRYEEILSVIAQTILNNAVGRKETNEIKRHFVHALGGNNCALLFNQGQPNSRKFPKKLEVFNQVLTTFVHTPSMSGTAYTRLLSLLKVIIPTSHFLELSPILLSVPELGTPSTTQKFCFLYNRQTNQFYIACNSSALWQVLQCIVPYQANEEVLGNPKIKSSVCNVVNMALKTNSTSIPKSYDLSEIGRFFTRV